MADKKISALTAAATPLAGTEVLPIVQSGSTVKVSVDNLTAGKSVSATSFVPTGSTIPTNGVYLDAANSVSIANSSAQSMTIRSGGIMGLGATPQSWYFPGSVTSAQQIGANTVTLSLFGNQSHFGSNFYLKTGTGNDTYINTGVAMRYRQDGGAHVFESAPSGTANTTITFTPLATVAANGNFTVHTNNIIVGTAGKGIDFSANGGDVLSQYDEGSWTVKLFDAAGGGNQSATTVTGYYTRVGNLVHCAFWGLNNISTAGMTAGNILHIELPFTSSATGSGTGSFASENITFNGRDNATPAVPTGTNRAVLRAYGSATSSVSVLVSNVGANANIDYFSLTYRV